MMPISLIAAAVMLSACAVVPHEKFPEPESLEVSKLEANIGNTASVIADEWWSGLGDPELDRLIQKALKASPSLTSADARMQAAQAAFEADRAVLIPQINVGGQVARQELSRNYIFIPGAMQPFVNYGMVAGSLQWSLDLWGKQKKILKAASHRLDGAQASLAAAKLNLAATIANVYIDYDHASKFSELAKRDADIRQNLYQIGEARLAQGLLDDSQLEQLRMDWELSKVKLGQAELSVKMTQHQLAALAGEGPSWGEQLHAPTLKTESLTQALPEKIPSDLLSRRPDLQALMSNIHASRLEYTAAKLDYLPSFDLQANFGYQSFGLDTLLTAPSQMFSIGPVFNLPIFDGGRIDANTTAKEASRNEAVAEYHEALLQALRQSADSIQASKNAKLELSQLSRAFQGMQSVFNANHQRLKSGIVSQEQLDAIEINLIRQQQSLADGQARLFNAHVALILSLGGGYQVKGVDH